MFWKTKKELKENFSTGTWVILGFVGFISLIIIVFLVYFAFSQRAQRYSAGLQALNSGSSGIAAAAFAPEIGQGIGATFRGIGQGISAL
jgi:hypothetical protein